VRMAAGLKHGRFPLLFINFHGCIIAQKGRHLHCCRHRHPFALRGSLCRCRRGGPGGGWSGDRRQALLQPAHERLRLPRQPRVAALPASQPPRLPASTERACGHPHRHPVCIPEELAGFQQNAKHNMSEGWYVPHYGHAQTVLEHTARTVAHVPARCCADTQRTGQAHQLGTVRPRSTSTVTRFPSTLRPSASLYAFFMSFLCSNSMNAYPRGLPAMCKRILCQIRDAVLCRLSTSTPASHPQQN